MELNEAEKQIITILRELPPYGKIEITADQSGKFGTFLVHKSHKVIVSTERQGDTNKGKSQWN